MCQNLMFRYQPSTNSRNTWTWDHLVLRSLLGALYSSFSEPGPTSVWCFRNFSTWIPAIMFLNILYIGEKEMNNLDNFSGRNASNKFYISDQYFDTYKQRENSFAHSRMFKRTYKILCSGRGGDDKQKFYCFIISAQFLPIAASYCFLDFL